MSSGDGPSVPEPTAEEQELQREQAELLRMQRQELEDSAQLRESVIPLVAEEMGFSVTREDGEITGFEPTEMGQQRRELESELVDRQLQALRGELPVSPALERDIEEQETQLRQRLRDKLGPGFESSSPGIDAITGMQERALIARDAARRGDLTTASNILTAREQGSGRRIGDLFGATGATTGFGQLAGMFGQAQQPFHNQRSAEFNAAMGRQQMQTNQTRGMTAAGASVGGAVGGPVGAGIGAGAGLLLSQVF